MKDRKILVVDDTNITREAIALILRKVLGFEVEEAIDGFSALEKVKTSTFAAILTDCDMRDMSGFECTARIRQLEKQTGVRSTIIGLSVIAGGNIHQKCLQAGMDDYLDKSWSNEELKAVLAKWIPDCNFEK